MQNTLASFTSTEHSGPTLAELVAFLAPSLPSPRPDTKAPFVWSTSLQSLDGAISFAEPHAAGPKEIGLSTLASAAAGSRADWRVLQASWMFADAVIIGAETLRQEPHVACLPLDEDLLEYRREVLKRPRLPLQVIVTKSGNVDASWRIFDTGRVLVATTAEAKARIEYALPADAAQRGIEVATFDSEGDGRASAVSWTLLLDYLASNHQCKNIDVSAGGTVLRQLIERKTLDEMRVTSVGHLVGLLAADGRRRPALFPSTASDLVFQPHTTPLLQHIAIRICGPYHTFTRYALEYRH